MSLDAKTAHSEQMIAPCTMLSSAVTRAAQSVIGQSQSEGRFQMHCQLTAGLAAVLSYREI